MTFLTSYCHTHTQVDPNKYRNMFHGFKITASEEGMRALAKGWAPTAIGYSMQGLCKFGFYEVFKVLYSNMLGEVSCLLEPILKDVCHDVYEYLTTSLIFPDLQYKKRGG